MKFLATVLSVTTFALAIGGCSKDTDNPTPPTPSVNEFVTAKTGSSFRFDQFSLEGDAASPTVTANGSGVGAVTGTAIVGGREAQVVITGFLDAASIPSSDTAQYHEANGAISTWYGIGSPALATIPAIVAGKAWVVVAHKSSATWTALDTTIRNVTFTYAGQQLTGDVALKITGEKVGEPDVTVDGKTISTVHSKLAVTGSITTAVPFLGTVALNLAFTEEYWFGKGVGLVRFERLPFVLPATPPIIPSPLPIAGRRIVLTSYVLIP